jgi:PhzF family phenazine biosynthesis protein
MSVRVVVVDAFTERAFAGNPAAVCVVEGEQDVPWMQNVAREMNLAATAFVSPARDGFALLWFSPKSELDLCGHGTLAAAHVLWEDGQLGREDGACFLTRRGPLVARRDGGWIWIDFAADLAQPVRAGEALLRALGVAPTYVGKSSLDYLMEVESPVDVELIAPGFALLRTVPTRGVIVTSRSPGGEYDFVSRFFAPRFGIDEDPVTGSAHCCLGPFWGYRLGKTDLIARQLSLRTGDVRVRLRGDRVHVGGHAKTVVRGQLADG